MGTIGIASKDGAGLMSAAQAATVDNFAAGVDALVPFTGLRINDTDVKIARVDDGSRVSNIGLDFATETKTVDGKELKSTFIVLKDLAADGTAISKVDVTEFVKQGLLADTDIITDTENNKTYLKFYWNLANGETKEEVIDVSRLVDVYTNGNGISYDAEKREFAAKAGNNTITVDADGIKVNTDVIATKTDLESYYTKTEADGLLDAKADADDVYTKSEVYAKTETYSKTEADGLLNAKANVVDVYSKTEADGLLNAKANADNVYSKTEADDLLDAKANADNVYTKSQTYSKSETYSKTEIDNTVEAINAKVDEFVPMTDSEIYAACGMTYPAPEA
jgi:hypothetical protein